MARLTTPRTAAIAGDQHEMFISVVTFDTDYLRYVHNEIQEDAPKYFLKIEDFGPFKLSNRDGVKQFCWCVLALMLHFKDEKPSLDADGIMWQEGVRET